MNDADTGLVYMQQRYYDPVAGRFLSIDPVTTDANTGSSFNRYNYAGNNPYRYVDPDGRGPVGWTIILLKNGGERIGKALASHADAVAARKAGEDVTFATKAGAKAAEAAKNGGDTRNILKHEGHNLPNGGTGRPHYQTDGSYGHSFWGKASAVFLGFEEAMKISQYEIWNDIKSDPIAAVCWICSAGNESNDSDKVSSNPAVIAEQERQARKDTECGVSCLKQNQHTEGEPNR